MKSRSFFLLILMCVGISGCGGDSVTDEPVPANFMSATPPGGELSPLARIEVLFDKPPIDVVVNFGTVTVAGRTATISGPFTPGPLALRISWAGGSHALIYTVHGPCCEPPTITGGTVTDGATDVDPEVINSDGKIVILFSEDVSGNIVVQTEGGDNVGWIGKIEGNTATLALVKGKEIANETTYVIRGKVSDGQRYPHAKAWGLCFLATAVFSKSPPSYCRSTLGSQTCPFDIDSSVYVSIVV